MITSDLVRAALAAAFMLCLGRDNPSLLYLLSAALMFASPFFNSGRSAILPKVASADGRPRRVSQLVPRHVSTKKNGSNGAARSIVLRSLRYVRLSPVRKYERNA